MRSIRTYLLPTLLAASLAPIAVGQDPPRFYEHVAVSPAHVAFVLAGELWQVPIAGGRAAKLSTTADDDARPIYSPDGSQIAFTRGGAMWVMPAGGGEARRLTWYPRAPFPLAWTPDGAEILFASSRDGDGNQRGILVPASGGPERQLALSPVRFASFAPDGKRLALIGWSPFLGGTDRRYYRGGMNDGLQLLDPNTGKGVAVPLHGANAIYPMWVKDKVYYATDSSGSFNLAVFDPATGKSRELTSFRSYGVFAAAASPAGNVIAFIRDGHIHLFDVATEKIRTLSIDVTPDLSQWDSRNVTGAQWATDLRPGPNGERVAIEYRGDAIVLDARTGAATNLTHSSAAADRSPTLSPDGKSIAWFSDGGGEYALNVGNADGSGSPKTIALGSQPTYFRGLTWSPDARRIAFSDQRLTLWIADVNAASAAPVDSSSWIAQGLWQTSWSPDSRWLAYAKADSKGVRSIWLRDVERGIAQQLSRGGADDTWPVFDPTGRWLYFATSSNSGMAPARDVWSLQSDLYNQPFVSHLIVVAPLHAGDVLPFLPFNAGANARAATPPSTSPSSAYDVAAAAGRAIPLPIPPRNVQQLWMGSDGALIAHVTTWPATTPFDDASSEVLRIDPTGAQRPSVLATNVDRAEVSADGRALLVGRSDRTFAIVPTSGGDPLPLDLSKISVTIDPRAEWRQIYHEAFRMMRDEFYDPNHHGVHLDELESHFAAYLPGITRRSQLNDLLLLAFGEISVSHLVVAGGDERSRGTALDRAGVLGADFDVANGRFRFRTILRNGPYYQQNPLLRAPLDQGGEVHPGDYLLAVDGTNVVADKPVDFYFAGKSGHPTTIRVGPDPGGANARELTVVPAAGENGLRRANWAMQNAARVAQRSQGQLAYVHINGWNFDGIMELQRALTSARDAKGLIVDERFNGGGITADDAISWLTRQPWYDYLYPHGSGFSVPQHLIDGPKVLLINESNASAAETFAMMFQQLKAGTIVGRRTWGGGIGGALFIQRLIDGGRVTIPNRGAYDSTNGIWGIENRGVVPDVDVPITQEDAVAGRDPQLDRAIDVAMSQLATHQPRVPKRPAMPVHPPRE